MIQGKIEFIGSCSKFQAADIFDVRRLARAVERDDDGQTNRDFSGRHSDDEENENLRVVVGQAA